MIVQNARTFDPSFALTPVHLVLLDHSYRYFGRSPDLTLVRDLVHEFHAPTGQPSIDPVGFFKLLLVMFFEGIRSERQFVALALDRLDPAGTLARVARARRR